MSLKDRSLDALHGAPPWDRRDLPLEGVLALLGERYPVAGSTVGGLEVAAVVPNRDSIGASIEEAQELPSVRRVAMADFGGPDSVFYAADDFRRAHALAEQIRSSGWVAPLIVVVDAEGPYLLEGAHRFVALHELGARDFPAVVVADVESLQEVLAAAQHKRGTGANRPPR
jgi:hypothetical protein